MWFETLLWIFLFSPLVYPFVWWALKRLRIGSSRQRWWLASPLIWYLALPGDDFFVYAENHIAYYLGFVPGLFNIDPDVLDLYFEGARWPG